MICDRCGAELLIGDYPFCKGNARDHVPARQVVIQDSIEGGLSIAHGLCNANGTPRTYYARSEIRQEAQARGLLQWSDVWTEDRTKDARVHADWLRSGEAQRARRDRVEARAEKQLARERARQAHR